MWKPGSHETECKWRKNGTFTNEQREKLKKRVQERERQRARESNYNKKKLDENKTRACRKYDKPTILARN